MIDISLITPFRRRLDDLDNLINSLKIRTKDKGRIEVIIVIDRCDEIVYPIRRDLEDMYKEFNLKVYDVERSDHFSKDYYNYAAKKSNGRWIQVINDDSLFMTQDWDHIVCEKMESAAKKCGDDILFGVVNDGMTVQGSELSRRTFSCFPLLSKEYCNLMNGVLIEDIYTWGGDFWLGQVFNKVRGGTRRVMIQEVLIDHNSHHNQKEGKEQDEFFFNFIRIEKENPSTFNTLKLNEMVKKINDYIRLK